MDINEILKYVDHTNLSPAATIEDIKKVCDDGIKYGVASVCIPPSYVKDAKKYVENKINICTVIGFPNGYSTTEVKMFETENALSNGADEIDMVINIGCVKNENYSYVQEEIDKIRSVCGNKILKVIIEACLLDREEKINLCRIITECKADFIKTSTGFSKSGAVIDDIKLFSEYIGGNVKIKAAGGINTIEQAEEFINAGASRLGMSRMINIIKNLS